MRRYLLLAIAVVTTIAAIAAPIDEEKAKSIAQQYLRYQSTQQGKYLIKGAIPNVKISRASLVRQDIPDFYIVTNADSTGFVLIADDDAINPVLGYSLTGSFSFENMPPALILMMKQHAARLESAQKIPEQEEQVGPLEPGNIIVSPYLKTQWNQDEPYNWLTPIKDGRHAFTGCVNTAAAQVMNHYQWPPCSYFREYDWPNMRNTYGSYNHIQGMAVATLMRDLGVIMHSTYGSNSTSTYVNYYEAIPGYNYTKITTLEGCKSYIKKGPLLISINGGISHAVIIDGLDSNDYYHVNWGWGGHCDGYYTLSDMAIEYNSNVIHPAIDKSWTYYLTPNKEQPFSLAATRGVDVDCSSASSGKKVTVTLKGLKRLAGNSKQGFIGLRIYKKVNKQEGGYYSDETPYLFENASNTSVKEIVKSSYTASNSPKDVTLTFTMGKLSQKGNYYLVPVCSETDNENGYHQMVHYIDGIVNNDITFEYKNGVAYFTEFTPPSYDVKIEKVITASQYREEGESQALALLTNNSNSDFLGKATFTLKRNSTTTTFDADVFVPANTSQYCVVNLEFPSTGTYRLTKYELWQQQHDGTKKTYGSNSISCNNMMVHAAQEVEPETQIINSNMYVFESNNTVYQHQMGSSYFYLYMNGAASSTAYVEAVASAIGKKTYATVGTAKNVAIQDIVEQNYHITSQKISLNTNDLAPGDYSIVGFYCYKNNTNVIKTNYKNWFEIDPTSHSDELENIIHVLDPGIDVPQLKVISYQTLDKCYFDNWCKIAVEIENTSDIDVLASTGYSNSTIYSSEDRFYIKAGERAIIYPSVYRSKKNYNGETNSSTGELYLDYKLNNGKDIINFPFDNNKITLKFSSLSSGKKLTHDSPLFYYRTFADNQKPSNGFYSNGTVKRTIYKDNNIVLTLADVTTNNSYSTYQVYPTMKEIKTLANGEYFIKMEVINKGESSVSQTYIRPLIIEDKYIDLTIDKVSIVKNNDLAIEDDIPFIVRISNPNNEMLNCALNYVLQKYVVENGSTYYYTQDPHYVKVQLPAATQSKFNYTARIVSESLRTPGDVAIAVCYSRRIKSGALDLSSSKVSSKISLPFQSSGITEVLSDSTRKPVAYYDINGRRLSSSAHGIVIVKYDDGTTEKIYIP